MSEPVAGAVRCLSPAGFHTMRYRQWGDRDNPRVLVCVHGLTRVGRDFDRLARAMMDRYRVVCPDVAGRGDSDWLRNPAHYQYGQYAADMVTLIARLGAESVDWVGTSMGGLIGIVIAGQEGAPVGRLVLNDVGPRLEPEAIGRIASYVGQPLRFRDLEQATDYIATVSAPFGLRTRVEWREITESVLRIDPAGGESPLVLHYDPAIGVPFKALTPELLVAGEAVYWQLYDHIRCPTLLLRGETSDLLSKHTAVEMTLRGPRARLIEVPGVGHAPMLFDPQQIHHVRSFLLE